jgi:hypothetical protein
MDDNKPNLELGIYRVTHTIVVGEVRYTVENDFISRDGELILVLEWGGPTTSPFPLVTLELDPEQLTECPGMAGYYTYSGQLVDPRKVQ